MSNKELVKALKTIIFEENKDDIKNPTEAFEIGNLSNEKILENISSILEFHKNNI